MYMILQYCGCDQLLNTIIIFRFPTSLKNWPARFEQFSNVIEAQGAFTNLRDCDVRLCSQQPRKIPKNVTGELITCPVRRPPATSKHEPMVKMFLAFH